MTSNSTLPSDIDPHALIASLDHAGRREDALQLLPLFERVSGEPARVWSGNMIGFGQYDYTYESGHSGTWFRTGFAPRKGNMVVYIMPGYDDHSAILERLGPHKLGKSCLYLGRLNKIDLTVLEELVAASLDLMRQRYPT